MARISNQEAYAIKSIPVADDYLIGTDSVTGKTFTFRVGDLVGDGSGIIQNNRGKIIDFGNATSPSESVHPNVDDKVNNLATQVEVLEDEYPIFVGFVSIGGATATLNTYLLTGKGKGVYGSGGTISIDNGDLVLINEQSTASSEPPVIDDPNANVEDLGEIPSGDYLSVINNASPAYNIVAGTNWYFEYTVGGIRYIRGFKGTNGIYGLGELQMVENDLFLIYDETILPVVSEPTGLELITEGGNDGWRFVGRDSDFYGDIGEGASDLSFNNSASSTKGATGDYSFSANNGTIASGIDSAAFNTDSESSGTSSFAANSSQVDGDFAVGFGTGTSSGDYSFTAGIDTVGSGKASGAIGDTVKALSYGEIVVGLFNTAYSPNSTTAFDAADRLFGIGNGTGVGTESDAFIILKDGTIIAPSLDNTKINTAGAKAVPTKEYNDANYTAIGDAPTGLEALDEGNGNGFRIIGKAAANYGDIGLNATDVSNATVPSSTLGATGTGAFASGYDNTSSGDYSFTGGQSNIASQTGAFAINRQNTASGIDSVATGLANTSSGAGSFSSGNDNISTGDFSLTNGIGNTSPSYAEVTVGTYAETYVAISATSYNSADRVFCVGNGTSSGSRSNALTVFKTGIVTTPSQTTALIAGEATGKVVVTREYAEANFTPALVKLDEGNGDGIVIKDRVAANYGDVGFNSSDLSFSSGVSTTLGATGDYSFATGFETTASGNGSIATGVASTASGNNSATFNNGNTSSGLNSFTANNQNTAPSFAESVFGTYSTEYTATNPTGFDSTDRLFNIGNGTGTGPSRSDAFTILKSGEVTLPSQTIAIIDAEPTGKAAATKEWVLANAASVQANQILYVHSVDGDDLDNEVGNIDKPAQTLPEAVLAALADENIREIRILDDATYDFDGIPSAASFGFLDQIKITSSYNCIINLLDTATMVANTATNVVPTLIMQGEAMKLDFTPTVQVNLGDGSNRPAFIIDVNEFNVSNCKMTLYSTANTAKNRIEANHSTLAGDIFLGSVIVGKYDINLGDVTLTANSTLLTASTSINAYGSLKFDNLDCAGFQAILLGGGTGTDNPAGTTLYHGNMTNGSVSNYTYISARDNTRIVYADNCLIDIDAQIEMFNINYESLYITGTATYLQGSNGLFRRSNKQLVEYALIFDRAFITYPDALFYDSHMVSTRVINSHFRVADKFTMGNTNASWAAVMSFDWLTFEGHCSIISDLADGSELISDPENATTGAEVTVNGVLEMNGIINAGITVNSKTLTSY
jgi:hypothetical protein